MCYSLKWSLKPFLWWALGYFLGTICKLHGSPHHVEIREVDTIIASLVCYVFKESSVWCFAKHISFVLCNIHPKEYWLSCLKKQKSHQFCLLLSLSMASTKLICWYTALSYHPSHFAFRDDYVSYELKTWHVLHK